MILLLRCLPLKKASNLLFVLKNLSLSLLISICFASSAFSAVPVDGTFLLRERKHELDQQLRARLLENTDFQEQLKASSFPGEMIVGETETGFQVYNFAASTYEYRVGRLVGQGKRCNLYVEKGMENILKGDSGQIYSQIINTFDNKVFPTVTAWFGEPVIPSQFAWPDDRIYIFLLDIRDQFDNGYVAGYFDHRDLEGVLGNQKPVFFMDLNPGEPGDPDDKNNSFYRTLAHEFQHMVNFSIRHSHGIPDQERWLDEGLAMFSEYIFSEELGSDKERIPPTPHFERFVENPAVNLISDSKESWFREDRLFRQYGASFMFVAYLIEKYGGATRAMQQGFLREFVKNPDAGIQGINNFFTHLNINFTQIFAAFTLAMHLDNETVPNPWGFRNLQASFGKSASAMPLRMIRHYASSDEGSFIGGDNHVLANSIRIEEIAGKGKVALEIQCASPVEMYLAELLPDHSGLVRKVPLVAGRGTINGDFSDGRRMFLLPMAISQTYRKDESFNYSFRSRSENLVLYPVPNPAFENQFLIFLKSQSGALAADPILRVSFGNLLDTPKFTPVDDSRTIFIASYQIPGEGNGQAFCYHETDSCSFSFSAVKARSGQAATAVNAAFKLVVNSAESGVAAVATPDAAVMSLPVGMIAGPLDIFFPPQASASIFLPEEFTEKDGICRRGEDGKVEEWIPLRKSGGELVADLLAAGRYYIGRDQVPPVLRELSASRIDNNLFLQIDACDEFSGVNRSSLKVFVDDQAVSGIEGNDFRMVPVGRAARINGNIEVEIADYAGNTVRGRLSAASAITSRLIRFDVYPNPCSRFAELSLSFRDKPVVYEAIARVYDVSGRHVRSVELQNAGAGKNAARWNLADDKGRTVSNGVYLVKVRARTDQGELKTTGKIAVLR